MDFRQLRYFIAVAEERHFRRAAERLHMSQPPLSQQISALEEELGTVLLKRDRRSVHLTTAGEAFLRRARTLLDQASSAASEARRIGRGEIGRLVIGFMSSAMLSRFSAMLGKFRADNPDVMIELIQLPPQEQIEAIANGKVDVGFLSIAPSREKLAIEQVELKMEQIWEEELVAAVPAGHKLANQATIPLRALASDVFITLPRAPETGHYDQVLQLCEHKGGFRIKIGQEVEQLPVVLALIAAGYGVSLIPSCAIDGWQGQVAFPRLKERPRIPVTMLRRADNSSPVLEAFRRMLSVRTGPVFFPAANLRRRASR
ncbi:MAG: LysR family transcriptional regulator [Xanthobacteraceae bacterium]|nr:MAG: LysR family transcriptional regulator [Xanthobacteraceae bacterium]